MKKKIALLYFLVAIILLSSVTAFIYKPSTVASPKPVDGMLDLSSWSFKNNGIVSLGGTWSFYYNRFLTHEDFARGVDATPSPIDIPSTKDTIEPLKPIVSNKFYGTLRLLIKLPSDSATYGLRSDIVMTSYQLYIDGKLCGEVGKVGTSTENSVPYYNILTTYFNPESNVVELIYHTSDFTAGDCTISAPQFGLASQISKDVQLGLGRDLFLFGMLLIMGIYHFGLYIMRAKDRAPLYFGIFCLAVSLRMLLVGERFLPSHLTLSFLLYGRIAYICVFIGASALFGFLYHALDGLMAKWYLKSSAVMGIIFSFLLIWVPYGFFDKLLFVYAIFVLAMLVYSIFRLIVGTFKRFPFSAIVLFGFAFLGITFVNDFIYQITLANTPSLIPLGVTVFTFTQAYTLSTRFSNAFTRAEQLSEENHAMMSELKLMNTNLESLVSERTADLQKALEDMEMMSWTDYLTKLPNRRLILSKINDLVKQKRDFYIGLADIDHFKEINDRFGHVKGDEILVRLSEDLSAAVNNCGFVGRWGGEEFLIVLETDCVGTILDKADEIRAAVAERQHDDIGRDITVTIGLCRYRDDVSLDALIAEADQALYEGKLTGRNKSVVAA